MATAQRGNGAPGAQSQQKPFRTEEASLLLEQMIQTFTPSERTKVIYDTLTSKIETIRDLLCDQLKPSAERFVKRGIMTFNSSEKLKKCSPASFIKAVLQAAECGLALDGKLAYAIPRENSKKDERGNWYKEWEASFQPSYIGLIAVAKRTKTVLAVYGDIICENDLWEYERRLKEDHFIHRRAPLGTPRGKVIGAYQKLILPTHITHIEVMDILEINEIMKTSESWKFAEKGKQDSTWHKHPGEMQKKTVVHRALKTYQDDPGLMVAMEAIESDYERIDSGLYVPSSATRVGRSSINDRLGAAPATQSPPTVEESGSDYGDDEPPLSDDEAPYSAGRDNGPQVETPPKTKQQPKGSVTETEADATTMRTLIERVADAETPMEINQVRDDIGALSLSKMQRAELDALIGKRRKELGA